MQRHENEQYAVADQMARDVIRVADIESPGRLIWRDIRPDITHNECHKVAQNQLRKVEQQLGTPYLLSIPVGDWQQMIIMAAARGDDLAGVLHIQHRAWICAYTHPSTNQQAVDTLGLLVQMAEASDRARKGM
jgi:hypothetical protein